jgi:hypothetical protein
MFFYFFIKLKKGVTLSDILRSKLLSVYKYLEIHQTDCRLFVLNARKLFQMTLEESILICCVVFEQQHPWSVGWASWSWSHGSWIYNYLCNQCLSPLMLWVRILIRVRCTTLCDNVCQWLTTGRWFSPDPPVSSTNKTDCHDIAEILLNVALNIIKQTNPWSVFIKRVCDRHPALHMGVSDIILRFRPQ